MNETSETIERDEAEESASTAPKLSRWRRLCFGLLYLSLTTGVTFLVIEVAVRILAPQELQLDAPDFYRADPAIGWRHATNVKVAVNQGERLVWLCSNNWGHRVSCQAKPERPCRKRVLVLGDSFVEAMSIPFDQLVWARLEKDMGVCFDVAGVGAHGLAQYQQNLHEHLEPGRDRYDLVIVNFYEGNDFFDPTDSIPAAKNIMERPWRLLPAGLFQEAIIDWFYPINQILESRSHAYVALRQFIRLSQDRTGLGMSALALVLRPSQLTQERMNSAVVAIERMTKTARDGGIPTLLVYIPFMANVIATSEEEIRRAYPELRDDVDLHLAARGFLPRLSRVEGLQVVDLTPSFREKRQRSWWGTYDKHFSPKGHAAWFRIIRPTVRQMLAIE
jgi:hypothetical protein